MYCLVRSWTRQRSTSDGLLVDVRALLAAALDLTQGYLMDNDNSAGSTLRPAGLGAALLDRIALASCLAFLSQTDEGNPLTSRLVWQG